MALRLPVIGSWAHVSDGSARGCWHLAGGGGARAARAAGWKWLAGERARAAADSWPRVASGAGISSSSSSMCLSCAADRTRSSAPSEPEQWHPDPPLQAPPGALRGSEGVTVGGARTHVRRQPTVSSEPEFGMGNFTRIKSAAETPNSR